MHLEESEIKIIIKKTHSERETMKIGVIGYGNMGSMIVNNILKLNLLLDDEELIVSNRHLNKFESLIEEYPEENLNSYTPVQDLTSITSNSTLMEN